MRPTLAVAALLSLACAPALAQDRHDLGHPSYQNWINGNNQGCCNDRDCGELADENERAVGGKIEVRIEGEWCPVLSWHYLKRGNAPNWQKAHVCVAHPHDGDARGPCERLLCYQPKPGF